MSFILLEYVCDGGHRTESLEKRAKPAKTIACETCGAKAVRGISAVKHKTCWAAAGAKGLPEQPPSPTATNAIPYAEGMPRRQWKAERAKIWRDHDRKKRRARGAPI